MKEKGMWKDATKNQQANNVEDVSVNELIVHPRNARRGNIDAIVASIEANGWWGTLVAQKSTKHVLAGNHRLMAAQVMGMATVPVYWIDCDDDEATRILLADNRVADLADYDDQALLDLLSDFDNDLVGLGFDERDIEELTLSFEAPEPPNEFPSFDETLETEHVCPKCGYEF